MSQLNLFDGYYNEAKKMYDSVSNKINNLNSDLCSDIDDGLRVDELHSIRMHMEPLVTELKELSGSNNLDFNHKQIQERSLFRQVILLVRQI